MSTPSSHEYTTPPSSSNSTDAITSSEDVTEHQLHNHVPDQSFPRILDDVVDVAADLEQAATHGEATDAGIFYAENAHEFTAIDTSLSVAYSNWNELQQQYAAQQQQLANGAATWTVSDPNNDAVSAFFSPPPPPPLPTNAAANTGDESMMMGFTQSVTPHLTSYSSSNSHTSGSSNSSVIDGDLFNPVHGRETMMMQDNEPIMDGAYPPIISPFDQPVWVGDGDEPSVYQQQQSFLQSPIAHAQPVVLAPSSFLPTMNLDSKPSSTSYPTPTKAAPPQVTTPAIIPSNPFAAPLPPPVSQTKVKKAAAAAAASNASSSAATPAGKEKDKEGEQGAVRNVSKQACIACRKLKASCDNSRPCQRCVRFCRECVDRSEAELAEAKQRRKRVRKGAAPEKVAAASAASAIPNAIESNETPASIPAPLSTNESTALISMNLYSRSLLGVLITLGVRDLVVSINTLMDSLDPRIPQLLQWQAHATFMGMHLAGLLNPSDFQIFLNHGLTPEQKVQPAYTSSPLQEWCDLRTRPLHYSWQRTPVGQPKSEWAQTLDQSTLASLQVTWLPEANQAFHAWEMMKRARQEFERRLRTSKQCKSGGVLEAEPVNNLTPEQEEELLMQLADAASHDAAAMNGVDEMTALIDAMSCISVGRALTQPMQPKLQRQDKKLPHATKTSDGVLLTHAVWCPFNGASTSINSVEESDDAQRKKQRTSSSNSNGSTSSAAATRVCLCESSTPLPVRLEVNTNFERLFGWSLAEIEYGYETEGMAFTRRFYPPSIWPALQMAQANQWRGFMRMIELMAHQAAERMKITNALTADTAKSIARDLDEKMIEKDSTTTMPGHRIAHSHTIHTQIMTRYSAILPCIMRKVAIRPPGAKECSAPTGFCSTYEVVPFTPGNWSNTIELPDAKK